MIVADASAVGSFLLPDEAGTFADFSRERCSMDDVHVPPHWRAELASIIWKAQRRKRIDDADAALIATSADTVAETVTVGEVSVARTLQAAWRDRLTPYDAAYLVLAESLGAALLTADGALGRAAEARGLKVLMP